MSTPRLITLWRVPDLQTLHDAVARLTSAADPLAARDSAVIVPTRGAAEALRRTLENRALAEAGAVAVLPDLLTRADFYARLHRQLPGAPPLLSEFEREVLVRRAARLASESGSPAPFRLRAGLIVEILALYDDLRRRGRTVADFERLMTGSLEGSADTDRGAERMLRQTHFLAAVFRELERRVTATGRLDEHGLRARLLEEQAASPYRQIVLTVGDQAGEARGLWLADYDLLARVSGVERIDLLATEQVLAAGLHQRTHDTFPGLSERRLEASVIAACAPGAGATRRPTVGPMVRLARPRGGACRLRPAREAGAGVGTDRDRLPATASVPLPRAQRVRRRGRTLPGPAMPDPWPPNRSPPPSTSCSRWRMSEASRAPLVDLLASPHWRFDDEGEAVDPSSVAAFDALLRELKYLGGWEPLEALAAEPLAPAANRTGRLRAKAQRGLQAAAGAAREIREAIDAPTASAQFGRLVAFIKRRERLPGADDPAYPDHARARAAILGALDALADAHAAHDDEAAAGDGAGQHGAPMD